MTLADKTATGLKGMSSLKAIPERKLATMAQRTFWSLVFLGFAIVGAWRFAWPWWVVMPCALGAGVIMSGQIVLAPIKSVLALVKEARK